MAAESVKIVLDADVIIHFSKGGILSVLPQMDKLELHDRLRKEANTFLMERFSTAPKTDEELSIQLETIREDMRQVRGRNDWRTALIRGLQNCPQFNAGFLASYIRYLKSMSRNSGA